MLESRVRQINFSATARSINNRWKAVSNHDHFILARIWVLWDPTLIHFETVDISKQVIHGKVTIYSSTFFVSFVYGLYKRSDRNILWRNLKHWATQFNQGPWLILGDFNVTRYHHEHSNKVPTSLAMRDFNDCLNDIEVEDLQQTGILFSWNNNRTGRESIGKKLDRPLGNWHWFKMWGNSSADFQSPGVSDHTPICIHLSVQDSSRRPFKVLNFWSKHDEFLPLVRRLWRQESNDHLFFECQLSTKIW
ncbi:Exo_endo_phos domain-containing protein [Cephalotus follicularis]|uniref:Exo_endo_phos domain-containing protein n=1 Tax=Cephalotus follicularis TaxID=3775 RepID=A0A1Q3BS98_CEPFO|nr:Exo_endo_phos domain-containing protein [Cephalotus follicularis]